MEVIEGVTLSELCDYSFGDQSGQWSQIYTHFMKDAPEGTSPNDNIALWTERHESHNASVAGIASIADWTEELSTWEQNPNAVFGATIMTATADGISNEYIYGLG